MGVPHGDPARDHPHVNDPADFEIEKGASESEKSDSKLRPRGSLDGISLLPLFEFSPLYKSTVALIAKLLRFGFVRIRFERSCFSNEVGV